MLGPRPEPTQILCASLNFARTPAVIFVFFFGTAAALSLAQPVCCSQTRLGQGYKKPVGVQALVPHLQ